MKIKMRAQSTSQVATLFLACLVFGCISESETCCRYCIVRESTQCGLDRTILECASSSLGVSTPINGFSIDSGSERDFICRKLSVDARTNKLTKITSAIRSALNYVRDSVDFFDDINTVLALSLVKGVDDAHQREFQQSFPLLEMASKVCPALNKTEDTEFCKMGLAKGDARKARGKFIPADVINDRRKLQQFTNLGNEEETLSPVAKKDCQGQLVMKCEQTSACKNTFFAAEPTSQYMLTHQLLQRMMADAMNCEGLSHLKDAIIETDLCAKMYMEAELIAHLKYPGDTGDVFLEYVGFCGYKGYENFFRIDWLEEILSWQSKSGCFSPPRKSAGGQTEIAVDANKGKCDKHFTTVSLIALSAFYDHIKRDCFQKWLP